MAGIAAAVSAGLAFIPSAEAAPAAALVVGGTSFPSMAADEMAAFTNTFSDNLVNVPYPAQLWPAAGEMRLGASVADGAATLMAMIGSTLSTGTEIVVWGISQGALVLGAVQRALLNDPAAPPPDSMTFVRVADPATPTTGLLSFVPNFILSEVLRFPTDGRVAPESQYDTIVVVNEWDGFADFPDRPNLAAMVNAIVGLWYRHGQTATVELAGIPEQNITVTTNSLGATTTTYLVPSPVLPITQILRDIGISAEFVDPLEERLRPMVQAGYSRYDNIPDEPAAVAAATAAVAAEAVPVPAQQPMGAPVRSFKTPHTVADRRGEGRRPLAAAAPAAGTTPSASAAPHPEATTGVAKRAAKTTARSGSAPARR